MKRPLRSLATAALALASAAPLCASSYYPLRPDDPLAVYLEKGQFGVHGDGVADDSDALQQAINRVEETTHQGVVLIPSGRYRLGKTVYVWEGIRLIGYGPERPVFVLGKNTPGFQEGAGRYMIFFADRRPEPGAPVVDATEFTFYSGMSNIDFQLEEGNPAAVAIRFHVAQHGVLTHMDFHLGSARAALEDIGNQASDIHMYGGQYGIVTKKTSPAWQFLLMDSSFEGQSIAAIHTQEAGMTLIRDRFSHVPVAVEIADGQVEQLYGRDLQMEEIRTAALVLGDAQNFRSEVALENTACAQVKQFVQGGGLAKFHFRASAKFYVETSFSLGLDIDENGRERGILMHHRERRLARMRAPVASDIPALPPMDSWVNVHSLGVKGDGGTDDTAALQAAIDQHPVLFLPQGMYRLTGSLTLRPNTVLIGLNPGTTQLELLDDEPQFQGDGAAMALLIAPHGGTNMVTGIGVATGVGNPRAGGVLWMAGAKSLLEDMTFIPGRSFYNAALSPAGPKPRPFTPQERGRYTRSFETQNPDLWVKDGGGGIFRGLWTHGSFSKVGLWVENTSTPSRVYQLSCEHHIHVETQFHNVKNWTIFALQTEEENPAGADAIAVEIEDSRNLTFANTYMYRVSRNVLPKLYAVTVRNSLQVNFENVKVFSQTRLAFDNSVFEEGSGVAVRAHDFAHFAILRKLKHAKIAAPRGFARGAKLARLATGFSNASGLVSDAAGHVFFTDAAMHKIYRWNETSKQVELMAEIPGSPMVLGYVAPSTLLIVANEKAVFSLRTDRPGPAKEVSEAAPAPAMALLLPVGLHNELSTLMDMLAHRGYVYRRGSNTAIISAIENEHRGYFYAPGTNTAIMAGGTWRPILQSSQMAVFTPAGNGQFITSEDEAKTYSATLDNNFMLSTTLFAERGGTSVVADQSGNVYIASGQVYVYNRKGKQIGLLELPERPGSLAFGGPDHRTLFIGARGSLYAIRTVAAGW